MKDMRNDPIKIRLSLLHRLQAQLKARKERLKPKIFHARIRLKSVTEVDLLPTQCAATIFFKRITQ